ncbi:uncharacterized protein Ecym_1540 [Eremothecium cymbalariae DBVPG|uniref:L-type lectin-like domain-containing protein n=1 Tax=Eremothecium cymbalariae (strain CBS 270.75 / DBVPG 7215 / KCTC 17166 / NRRL Y-17582) TaxID=931890 RepID=G8JMU5_ERECY|nr:hypothetical protein Ecym_1540 [Eremothecium cymbalariae DBVPG\
MKARFIVSLVVSLLIGVSYAHSINSAVSSLLDKDFSLVELTQQTSLPATWSIGEGAEFKDGRIILTSDQNPKGSLWPKNNYDLKDSFTIEWTFRSKLFRGESNGGIAFWVVQEGHDNKKLFGGPSTFDGLQLLVSSIEHGGTFSGQLNDGAEVSVNDILDKSFGSCLFAYRDSDVPTTARLSYDYDNTLLKLQVDNKVCFQTKKIKFPEGKYRIGVTADNSKTSESFELLKFNVYSGLTDGAMLPNINAMPQPHTITKIIDKDTGKEKLVETSSFELSGIEVTNLMLYQKIDKLEGKVLANDIGYLIKKVEELANLQRENAIKTELVLNSFERFIEASKNGEGKNIIDSEVFQEFINVNADLKGLLDTQQREREGIMHRKTLEVSGPHVDEIIAKLTIWLIPLGILMSIMAYYTFRIRQDIVKAKLL